MAVILGVGAVLLGGSLLVGELTSRDADRRARALAAKVEVQLARHDRDEIAEVVAKESTDAWAGRESVLAVDGRIPERRAEVEGGFVIRYRLQGADERCVDALWPDGAEFRVVVNHCEPYERPAG